MRVWTTNRTGERVPAVVLSVGSSQTPRGHELIEVTLADGRRVRASAGHPTADGRRFDTLAVDDTISGARVTRLSRVPYRGEHTYDLLPSGETGAYWADGVLIGSTLR